MGRDWIVGRSYCRRRTFCAGSPRIRLRPPSGAAPPWLMLMTSPQQNGCMETRCVAGHIGFEPPNRP